MQLWTQRHSHVIPTEFAEVPLETNIGHQTVTMKAVNFLGFPASLFPSSFIKYLP